MLDVRLSERSLIIAVVTAFASWLLVKMAQQALWALVIVLVAGIPAAAMMPIVRVVRRLRLPPRGWLIPKALVVLLIYLAAFLAVTGIGYIAGRALLGQLAGIAEEIPAYVPDRAGGRLGGRDARPARTLTLFRGDSGTDGGDTRSSREFPGGAHPGSLLRRL